MFQPRQIYFLFARRLSSSSSSSPSSRLWEYGFKPPPIAFTLLPSSDPSSSSGGSNRLIDNKKPKKKQKKPPYKPPSSLLDAARRKPLHSDLPFDFRFSYTESDHGVRPIGLREPKYSPFGPNRIDRTWTGVSAPALDPKAAVEEVGGESASDELRQWRDRIQGAPLSLPEQKSLVERSQRHRTSRQINLGKFLPFFFLFHMIPLI